jgi:hypothetical protein
MKKTILLVLVVAVTRFAQARTITVGPGAGYDFGTIQAGIDTANDTDTVLVASGEYVITVPITFRGKSITVRSEAGPEQSTIRMGTPVDTNRGSVVIFENNETDASVLDGFTITGGRGSWVSSADDWGGGGICFDVSSGTVKNCTIVQNNSRYGGGVCCLYQCSPRLADCTIVENSAAEFGGGVFVYYGSSPTLDNCMFTGNSANWGGGVYYRDSSVTMTDCVVTGNTAKDATGGGVLGGLVRYYDQLHNIEQHGAKRQRCDGMRWWPCDRNKLRNRAEYGTAGE